MLVLATLAVGCASRSGSDLDRTHAACTMILGEHACSADCVAWSRTGFDACGPRLRPEENLDFYDCNYECAAEPSTNVDCESAGGGRSPGCDCLVECARRYMTAAQQRALADRFECAADSAAGRCY